MRIGGPVHNQRRRHYVCKGAVRVTSGLKKLVVDHRRDVDAAVHDLLDDRAHSGLVEAAQPLG